MQHGDQSLVIQEIYESLLSLQQTRSVTSELLLGISLAGLFAALVPLGILASTVIEAQAHDKDKSQNHSHKSYGLKMRVLVIPHMKNLGERPCFI